MSETSCTRTDFVLHLLRDTPSILRKTLLSSADFRKEYGLTLEGNINFGKLGASFKRSVLFDSIRELYSGVSKIKVKDVERREWEVRNTEEKGALPKLVLSADGQSSPIPDFAMLFPDSSVRLNMLAEAVSDVNLPTGAKEHWGTRLAEHCLEDDEVDVFYNDLRDTPVSVARSISADISTGKSSVESLVPSSLRYYERLVGSFDGSKTIGEYTLGGARKCLEQLVGWKPYDGFLFGVLLSSDAMLTEQIEIEHLSDGDLLRAYEYLAKSGDCLSLVGAIEIGLRVLPQRPALKPVIIQLVKRISEWHTDNPTKDVGLFATLFVLVDGELARTRVMSKMPPFYRRLASLAHAAIIQRELTGSGVDDGFSQWVFSVRGEQFYWQSLADLRLEPRWLPDFAAASQMKADFLGRTVNAGNQYKANIQGSELHDLILGSEAESLFSLSEFPYSYYPGPLQGSLENPNVLPNELLGEIETQLAKDKVGLSSFTALVNSAMIFQSCPDQVELAAKALRRGGYQLANLEGKQQLITILQGLATVAATSRNTKLADELRILTRRYKRDKHHTLSILEAMNICLLASASYRDLNDWRKFCGEWLTELAFEDFDQSEGKLFYSHLQCLCHTVPELWVSVAKADAALKAYSAIN